MVVIRFLVMLNYAGEAQAMVVDDG